MEKNKKEENTTEKYQIKLENLKSDIHHSFDKEQVAILDAIHETEKELLKSQARILKGIEDNDNTHDDIVKNVKKLTQYNQIRLDNIQTWVIIINVVGAVFGVLLYWLSNYKEIKEGFHLWLN